MSLFENITRRQFIWAMTGGGFFVIMGRLAYLQLLYDEFYREQARKNWYIERELYPIRGEIVDRYGRVVATSEKRFKLTLFPECLLYTSPKQRVRLLNTLKERVNRYAPGCGFDMSEEDVEVQADSLSKTLCRGLTFEEIAKLDIQRHFSSFCLVEEYFIRRYPYREAMAHSLGYTGLASEEDRERLENLELLAESRVGRTGIERRYEDILQGRPGYQGYKRTYRSCLKGSVGRRGGQRGEKLQLSIDADFQKHAYEKFQEYAEKEPGVYRAGSVVVLDVHTGEVYALVSFPSFDPEFSRQRLEGGTRGTEGGTQGVLLTDQDEGSVSGHVHRAKNGLYAPGSTFKVPVALSVLKQGLDYDTFRVNCTGELQVGRETFRCWKRHGEMDMQSALEESCDIYFYELSRHRDISFEEVIEVARDFGFGRPLDSLSDLSGGEVGDIPGSDRKWTEGDKMNMSIGQGELTVTPLQLTVMIASIANGGYHVQPSLAKPVPRDAFTPLQFSKRDIRVVMRAMEGVTMKETGTAYLSRITEEGYEMGGKTGTSQVLDRGKSGLAQEEREWRLRSHALFVGFAPLVEPRYAITVVIDHGESGSRVAAPLARDLLWEFQRREKERRSYTTIME